MKKFLFSICLVSCSLAFFGVASAQEMAAKEKKKETIEHTLAMIKPDAVSTNRIGEIIARLEKGGLKIIGMKMVRLSRTEAERFYAAHKGKPYFSELISYITSGPVVALALEGKNAIAVDRNLIGATDPKKAARGTIRSDFGTSIEANAIHGSDSLESALMEVNFFFSEIELSIR